MNNDVIIVGAFHEVIELCEDCGRHIAGIIDNTLTGEYFGYSILGTDADAPCIRKEFPDCGLVLTPDLPAVRKKLADYYAGLGFSFASLISAQARISRYATIGTGCFIQAGANVSACTRIGDFVRINTNANVMHDCNVGDYCTIAPNVVCLGRINIGEGAYLGANCTVLSNLHVGAGSVTGAGSVVTRDVPDGATVKGVPAK